MIRTALRSVTRFLASARLATVLLVFVGAWSVIASFVPQESVSATVVKAWATANPALEPLARALGLHQAFAAPLFMVAVFVLAVSTALCAWQRTKVAIRRARTLSRAASGDTAALGGQPEIVVPLQADLGDDDAISVASATVDRLGIRTARRDRGFIAASPTWSAWGSPVFHWALLALMVTILLGTLLRSSGQIGLAVGQSAPDEPQSYGILTAGPLHNWSWVHRTIRVDAFDPTYETGGVKRGPTPTVSVLDADGAVIRSQRVYPNKTLKTGSLTIYPADYGLAATVSLVDTSGAEVGRSVQLIDFSATAAGGTAPITYLNIGGAASGQALRLFVSIPLDAVGGGLAARLPKDARARLVLTNPDGTIVLDKELRPGDSLELPAGATVRLDELGYYARLQLVDDPSVPVLYLGLAVALLGLAVATLSKQHVVSGSIVDADGGRALAVRVRLWRNATSTRDEIESELVRALGNANEEETPGWR